MRPSSFIVQIDAVFWDMMCPSARACARALARVCVSLGMCVQCVCTMYGSPHLLEKPTPFSDLRLEHVIVAHDVK